MERSLLHTLQRFSIRYSIPVIIVILILSAIFGYFLLQVEINPEIEKLVPEDREVILLNQKYDADGEMGEYMILAVTSEDPFTIDGLQAFAQAAETLEGLPEVRSLIQPFSMVTFRKAGRKLEMLAMSPNGDAPDTREELELFRRRLTTDPFAEKLLISEDGRTLSLTISMYKREDYTDFMTAMDSITAELDKHYTTSLTGHPVLSRAVKSYLTRDLSRVLFLAIILILVIYYLGYRALRAPLMTLAVVGLGTIWCIGTMSLLGYTITVISITTPPLVLTLGSSYSIHILNQYYRGTVETKQRPRLWIADTVVHVNRTVLMAAGTTIIGFLSLLATKLEATREFGISTSIGIVYCAILSFFFLPALLNHLPSPLPKHQEMVKEGFLSRLLGRISTFVRKRKWYILACFAAVIVGFSLTAGKITYETEVMTYFPQKEKVIQDTMFIAEQIGGYQQFNLTLSAPEKEKNYFLQKEVLEGISLLEDSLNEEKNITKVISFVSYLKNLNTVMFEKEGIPESSALIKLLSRYIKALSSQPEPDETITLMANQDFSRVNLSIWVHDREKNTLLADEKLAQLVGRIKSKAAESLDPEIEVDLWGESLNYISLSRIIRRDQRVTTVLSFLFVFILTAAAFRSVKFGLYSLIPMATGILLNMIFMAVAGIPMDMTTVMFSIVVVGVGVDNAIHLILQFRKQQAALPDNFDVALENTLKIAGRPIVITTISIVAGFLIFSFASFKPIIYFGLLVAMALFTAAVGSLIILPAILSIGQKNKTDVKS